MVSSQKGFVRIGIIVATIIVLGILVYFLKFFVVTKYQNDKAVDGEYVVKGQVVLVRGVPCVPGEECTKGHKTSIEIAEIRGDKAYLIQEVGTDRNGEFKVNLSAGRYIFDPKDGKGNNENLPFCEEKHLTIPEETKNEIQFRCHDGAV